MKNIKNIVVGCGLSGMVIAERLASQKREEVLIIDRRSHIGGNIYDYKDVQTGITVHQYGPHAFHTNSRAVWEYVRQFSKFNTFELSVTAYIDHKFIPVPFNFNSLKALFAPSVYQRIRQKLEEKFGKNAKVPIMELRREKDVDLAFLADFVYKNVFEGYTLKQWGLNPDAIDPAVMARVPVFVGEDNRYFQDIYQGIPAAGYTRLAENILSNPLIKVELNTDWKDVKDNVAYRRLFYTGSIDEFFNYEYGILPYRSVYFEKMICHKTYAQPTPQVNYPGNQKWTRICEPKFFLNECGDSTILMREYSEAFELGKNERFYPIENSDNEKLLQSYRDAAAKLKNVYFLGRLGDYKYYNMDQCIARALELFEHLSE